MTKKKEVPWYWLRNSNGTASATVTFALIAFWVTTLAYVLSTFESIGSINFRQFDVAACSSYLVPILTLYFGRRWTEAKTVKTEEEFKE